MSWLGENIEEIADDNCPVCLFPESECECIIDIDDEESEEGDFYE